MDNGLTHYVVIRRDLTFGEYSAQLAHAGEVYAMMPSGFRANETTAVVKGIRNEGRLRKLHGQLIAAGVPHLAIIEEAGEKGGRLAGQMTCISLLPSPREQVEPYVREIHTIVGLDFFAGDTAVE